MAQASSHPPPGTFSPGTKVQVGSHRVTIDKYLSEGGFAHVYLVRIPQASQSLRMPATAVLKRVACPDKDALANMRTEVETMKKLHGHAKIVTYLDSHASQLQGGGYEVFLLMEFCSGGGLIDLMNTRLQHRLTEPEILHIFADVAEGVATMHYLQPPLLHRDLKVENVLITTVDRCTTYKLCDFGSTAPPRPAATTAAEGRLIEDDVQRHTTLQYRSPEMIDVYRKQPIDEKSDIWALGVLLYKLCYYTTPFEELGQMAILNATFTYPSYPPFSDRIKKLIGSMLREKPEHRPNIYQVVAETCAMRNRPIPIKDIYTGQKYTQDQKKQQLLPPELHVSSPQVVGLQKVAPVKHVQQLPEITPMRRGRPTAPSQQPSTTKSNISPMRGTTTDPFAALDSQDVHVRRAAADELAARFPSLDDFSLLHDRGQKFKFGETSNTDATLSMRMVEALADDAFISSSPAAKQVSNKSKTSPNASSVGVSRTASDINPPTYDLKNTPKNSTPEIQQSVTRRVDMVSTGVQTSPQASPPPTSPLKSADVSRKPIWKVPLSSHHIRTRSQPRTFEKSGGSSSLKPGSALFTPPPGDTTILFESSVTKPSVSSRPSLESQRPSELDLGHSLDRSRSVSSNARPVSIHAGSNLDYLRDHQQSSERKFDASPPQLRPSSNANYDSEMTSDEINVRSSMDYLRTVEMADHSLRHSQGGLQSKHPKRGSITKMVKGRFGDAFRRFEQAKMPDRERDELPISPMDKPVHTQGISLILTPIAGSEATSGLSDDGRSAIEETEFSPEVRRELEKEKLEEEERRVEAAAAEYKQRVASQFPGTKAGPSKASSIQNRVKELLDESSKSAAIDRTADGYGRYTSTSKTLPSRPENTSSLRQAPVIARKPLHISSVQEGSDEIYKKPSARQLPMPQPECPVSVAPTISLRTPSGPPPRAPKPKALRTGSSMNFSTRPLAKNSPGIEAQTTQTNEGADLGIDNWDVNTFSKRYPSLTGLELVETEIPKRSIRDI